MKHKSDKRLNFGQFVLLLIAATLLFAVPGAVHAGGAEEPATPTLDIPPQPRQFISPSNEDGVQDELVLPFSEVVVPGDDTVVVEYALTIFDGDGNPVYVQRERQEERRGFFGNLFGGEKPRVEIPESLSWDGRYRVAENLLPPGVSVGDLVPDGEYTYQLSIVDDERNTSTSPPFNVTVDNTPPEIGDFPRMEYTVFAPNDDGVRDTITFHLRGSREIRWVVRIVDERDETIYEEVFQNTTPRRTERDVEPPAQFVWDGTIGSPSVQDRPVAPEGEYRLVLSGEDRAGNRSEEAHPETVRISFQTADLILEPADGNRWFSPNNNGRRDTLPIRIHMTDPDLIVRWSLETVFRDQVVRTVTGSGAPPTLWEFDGQRQDRSVLPDGPVVLRLRATLINGTESRSDPLEVMIDTAPPEATVAFDTVPEETERGEPFVFGTGTKTAIEGMVRYEQDIPWTYSITLDDRPLVSGSLQEFFDLIGAQPRASEAGKDVVGLAWDGSAIVEDGAAPEGLYELVLRGEDRAGNRGQSRPMRVVKDSRTPDITLRTDDRYISPVTASPFSTIRYRVTTGAPERVREFLFEIRNDNNRVVRSQYLRRPFDQFEWNGLTNAGTVVPDGEYTARLEVFWQNGHSALVTGVGPVIVDRTAPRVERLAAEYRLFSPNGDGTRDTVRIDQRVVPGDDWTAEVIGPDGEVVLSRDYRDQVRPWVWDGRDADGNLVSDGEYRYVLSSVDAAGNRARESITIEVDLQPLVVQPPVLGIALDPQPFSPDGDGRDDTVNIRLSVDAETTIRRWTVRILDPRGRLFRTFSGSGHPPRRLVWDGLSSTGELVQSAMDYPVQFTVVDSADQEVTEEASIATDILVMREGDRYRIRVSNIHFAGNTPDLFMSERDRLEENLVVLRRLAQILNRYPNRPIIVEGHAAHVYLQSPESIAREQREELLPLSRRRAEEVLKALIILGVDRDRMSVEAVGGARPVVPHSDLENLWKNRRVEFLLDREQ
jgi:outer membrane protein OmpA-like peptidoglycan-associated protein/flagellar hook assembly protein FlgD